MLTRLCDCCNNPITEPVYSIKRELKSRDGKFLGSVSVYLKTATNSEDVCLDCILSALRPGDTPKQRIGWVVGAV